MYFFKKSFMGKYVWVTCTRQRIRGSENLQNNEAYLTLLNPVFLRLNHRTLFSLTSVNILHYETHSIEHTLGKAYLTTFSFILNVKIPKLRMERTCFGLRSNSVVEVKLKLQTQYFLFYSLLSSINLLYLPNLHPQIAKIKTKNPT